MRAQSCQYSTLVVFLLFTEGNAMQQSSDHFSSGPSRIASLNISKKVGSGAWGVLSGSDAYRASSDATLFSSSLPVLPHEKLNVNDAEHNGQSIDDISSSLIQIHPDGDGNDLIEDIEDHVVGSLLPDDEDELLAGIMDGFDLNGLPNRMDDSEDYDLFGSGGGLELDSDLQENLNLGMSKVALSEGVSNGVTHYGLANGVGTVAGEHPYGEHPSRTLFVRNINSNVEDSELKTLFEECECAEMHERHLLHAFLQYAKHMLLLQPSNEQSNMCMYSGSRKTWGFVMISYYDIRAARTAMRALQNKPLRRRKLDIHFSIPKENPSDKDINQGTLVVFNLDPSVSNDDLRQIFGAYGEVKEIRETPHKRHHKFIEYYDVRAAEAALRSLNRSDIAGKRIKLEPSRPGGARRRCVLTYILSGYAYLTTAAFDLPLEQSFVSCNLDKSLDMYCMFNFLRTLGFKLHFCGLRHAKPYLMLQLNQELEQDETRSFHHQLGSLIGNSPPGNWPQFGSPLEHSPLQSLSKSPVLRSMSPVTGNNLPGLASILHSQVPNSPRIAPIGKDHGRGSNVEHIFGNGNLNHGAASQQSHSLPDPKFSQHSGTMSSFGASSSNGSAIETLSGPQFLWGSPNLYPEKTSSAAWQTPTVGHSFTSNGQNNGFSHNGRPGFISSQHHHYHVGSAPSVVPLERHFGYYHDSAEKLFMNHTAFGSMGVGRSDRSFMGARGAVNTGVTIPGNHSENGSPGFHMMSSPRLSPMFIGNGPYTGLLPTTMEGLMERGRSRRAENSGSQIDSKKLFQLDLEKILSGEDTRTTLMIKNIPNKYTAKMLLAAIDENHRGTYDFLYLPIDFKNKCNVGYAFINMLSPSHIIQFYQAFNGKKWEKFNSEKVATLAYARIQGKAALVTHFQNSSLMNEDKRCRPILFHSEGSEAGDQIFQEPPPSNSLNIQMHWSNGSDPGHSSGSPTTDGATDKSSSPGKS
ncbi:hypothetical protein RJ640_012793 [Escallonia rubra]|uniref:RRM domain-containing protein n=1 Tax=Escallonia rubra TaxID=112253 RepID=A0AA88RPY4_9ASTE|nr:hypothetical protein RJ640_012793 [Escallonia rubra]